MNEDEQKLRGAWVNALRWSSRLNHKRTKISAMARELYSAKAKTARQTEHERVIFSDLIVRWVVSHRFVAITATITSIAIIGVLLASHQPSPIGQRMEIAMVTPKLGIGRGNANANITEGSPSLVSTSLLVEVNFSQQKLSFPLADGTAMTGKLHWTGERRPSQAGTIFFSLVLNPQQMQNGNIASGKGQLVVDTSLENPRPNLMSNEIQRVLLQLDIDVNGRAINAVDRVYER